MKHYIFLMFSLLIFLGCRSKTKSTSPSYSEIETITNQVEQNYLDQKISNISNVSVLAKDYASRLPMLEEKAKQLKLTLEKQQGISSSSQKEFIDSFEKSLEYLSKSDSVTLDLLKETPIKSTKDIDQLLLFMKRTFVNKASYVERYFFNIVGTAYSIENLNIRKGEDVSLTMNITAANTNIPAEWFILKDGGAPLTKENISDTLHPDEYGNVKFKRKTLQAGDNWIEFATKIPSSHGEVVLYKTAHFNVR